jgi:uncharacterized protein YdaU (DUF1376 family)
MIWYKFHIGDYITHTLHLSDAEDLAYRRLLDLYYISERPIPLDTDAVSRRIRIDLDITEAVLSEFFDRTDEGYKNTRCDAEIGRYQHQVEINKKAAKLGGRKKKTESEPIGNRKLSLTDTDTEEEKTYTSAAPTRFPEFWAAWPTSKRKVGKAAAAAKWQRHNLDKVANEILAHVEAMKRTESWTTGFEPAVLTYLNQRRWEDEEVPQAALRRVL